MITFHHCKKFKDKIKIESYKDDIYKKIDEYSARQELKSANIDTFGKSLYVLKISNPITRIIIEEKNILLDRGDIKVFFIRDIILSKNFDRIYGRTIFHKLKNGEWLKNNPLPKNEIELFKKEYYSSINKDIKKLDFPPKKLTKWFQDFEFKLDNEIFETEEWVRFALSKSSSNGMTDKLVDTFRIALQDIVNHNVKTEIEVLKKINDIEIIKYIKNDIGIIYSRVKIGKQNIFILYNGAEIKTQREYWNEILDNIKDKDIEFEATNESISRIAFRSYPKWTISHRYLWFAIEKSKEFSNLSLTKEQINFLKKFKFPYYINGQAGSGKSTMLYYLFANIYFLKAIGEIEGNLIFLTENEKLLEDTKRYVFDLLNNNPEFNGISNEDKEKSLKYFNYFKNFLLEILNEEDRILFKKDKYLNFSIFKELYENSKLSKNIINRYSAEEAWFTIITYIYGNSIEDKVTSNNYEKIIDKKSRVITLEKFKGIEKDVLPFYDKLMEDGYWDKLKIIKYILENVNMNLKQKYSVVICDEAQDFCKVELKFILKLSEYLKYDLSNTEQFPVVFAGDPNQTVNPTGFRQDEMTSMLYKELKRVNFNNNSNNNIYNPSLNYRSIHSVVSLANFVQYYRMKKLGIKQVEPQEAKRPIASIESEFNIFLNYEDIADNLSLREKLVKKLEHKIFIVPVDSQEKSRFIKNSDLLMDIKSKEVKTAVEAKGAEYSHVVLYGFGEYFLKRFKDLEQNIKDEDRFIIGYFFNKLYVGLTRAQTELIIIDSKQSEKLFWKKLVDKVEILNDKWKTLEKFKSKIIQYNPDTIGNIIDATKEDALVNAEEDKKQGEYHNNPARLRVASSQFLKLGNKDEANECLALAEEIMSNYKKASEYYIKSKKPDKASECLFKGKLFEELLNIKLKTIEHNLRKIIYRIMEEEKITQKDIETLSENKTVLNKILKDLDWRDELISKLILLSNNNLEIEFKRELVEVLKAIAMSMDKELWNSIAKLYYSLENYKKAIDAWEKIDFYEKNENYYSAKLKFAREEGDIESIVIYLDKLSLFQKEKKIILEDIIKKFKETSNNQNYSSEYFLAYYKACLILEKNQEIEEISKISEEKSTDLELINFYKSLLENFSLNKKIAIFIIERWAKAVYKDKNNFSIQDLEELNNKYLKFSKKHHIKYKKFTIEELKKISDVPKAPKWIPPKHLKKIKIKNFRQFNEIELENIGQFNLILGDNNVGKTSILEALLISSKKEFYFKNLAFAYIERKNIFPMEKDENKIIYDIPNDFINDFINRNYSIGSIEFELEENRNIWTFKIDTPTKKEIIEQLNINGSVNDRDYISIYIDNSFNVVDMSLLLDNISPNDSVKTRFIPFGKGFDKNLAKVYIENIDKNKKIRKNFLKSMKIFIPNIDRIIADTESGEIDIEETTHDDTFPLHQYGDGAKKLFRILVQITLQKDGKLLIDEIDAGIHYSHFYEFWKVILKVAKENNVQIFATTHNIECIEYFKDILEDEDMREYQSLSRIITLRELPNSDIKAYTRTFKEFKYEIDNELEVRGGDL
jgi:hypothetical protein